MLPASSIVCKVSLNPLLHAKATADYRRPGNPSAIGRGETGHIQHLACPHIRNHVITIAGLYELHCCCVSPFSIVCRISAPVAVEPFSTSPDDATLNYLLADVLVNQPQTTESAARVTVSALLATCRALSGAGNASPGRTSVLIWCR